MSDPELAEEWAKLPPVASTGPSLRGYTPILAKLDDMQDQIIALRGVMGSSSAAELKFTERPEPAYIEVRERNKRDAARATRQSVLSALLPGQEVV
ncbi:hypothetical protein [Rhodococcus opacus]|uniref:Uncharacterized protein n=1 Tax=Rhodococcus opacus TaxID=37919 RepID=A0A2S8JAT5_RHOOP|nr:hypothetical protein [Rhodococcus opacus]PQP24166.1 hypothetical protein C5613_14900 [Rhodococcus opacus]